MHLHRRLRRGRGWIGVGRECGVVGESAESQLVLADVHLGVEACIVAVCLEGALRERLHNHGFIEKNVVVPIHKAPFGGVRIYRVMNTLVALRREVASQIVVVLPAVGE